MKKENILKQIVLQEYGEKKHPKLTKNQFLLSSELYFEVERMYKELGGTQEETPLKFGAWDISTPKFIMELDEENHFNRYRLQTLNSNIYQSIKGFLLDAYKQFCVQVYSMSLVAVNSEDIGNPILQRIYLWKVMIMDA